MKIPTGSSLERSMICTGVVSLPHVNSLNEAASAGNALHDFHYWSRKDGTETAWKMVSHYRAEPLDEDLLKRLKQFELMLPKIPQPPGYVGELALCYDIATDTARVIGENVGRQYGKLGDSEIALSLDITGQEGNRTYVYDIKTGFTAVSPPSLNWQLRVGALAHSRAFRTNCATVGITSTKGLYPYTETADFDEMDLDGFASELQGALAKWKGEPKFTTGSHCAYCPAMNSCPAMTGLVKGVINKDKAANLDTGDWADAYSTLKALKAATKKLEDAIKFKASNEPIALKNGMHYGVAGNGTMKEFKK